ncbi:cell division protein ZipA C-terminal FtsZ-binding domain-containing protein [Halomonas sp. C05BenzN]|uniref:cell division protein ZipA C-terminal FtsZ-binding domain-containing protein n=1 Tax=Halomonas sp. C05BenzN TaxID=3411041 RepID=UPI003B946BC3
MNPIIGVVLLAGLAMFSALACLAVLYVMGRSSGTREQETASGESPAVAETPGVAGRPAGAAPDAGDARPARGARAVQPAKGVQQCLFVVLDRPGEDTNRRLAGLLEAAGARYDAKLGIYLVPVPRAGYELTIANASPPGTLPPLHEGTAQPVVGGVSILIKFINKHRVARDPQALIDFVQSVADLGGRVLDARRQEVTPDDIERLRHDRL